MFRIAVGAVVAIGALVLLADRTAYDTVLLGPAATCPRLGVPAYVPAPTFRAAAAGGDALAVVLNPASGPDIERDSRLAAAVAEVRDQGVDVLGYVHTDYGERPIDEIVGDAERYADWYEVDGIFLDEVSAEATDVDRYRVLADAVRAAGLRLVALNPGVYPDVAYASVADLVVTFEGTPEEHAALERPADWPAGGEWHLVHSSTEAEAAAVVDRAVDLRIDALFVTDEPLGEATWNSLPSWLPELRTLLADAC